MNFVLLVNICCRHCGLLFHACRSCWRGHAYCGDVCRRQAQGKARREAQRRYRHTAKGREAHRLNERRRRLQGRKKTMDDETSRPHIRHVMVYPTFQNDLACCRFCGVTGVVVGHFSRRGYGSRQKDVAGSRQSAKF